MSNRAWASYDLFIKRSPYTLRTTNSNKMYPPWPLPGIHCGGHFDDARLEGCFLIDYSIVGCCPGQPSGIPIPGKGKIKE
ncbi:hypothetical protein OUZ56_004967 [Daphnia magna]|uniref:Uncharacterized protein n=1 Tax=Daphnia magna TaxID=35525 RepID=A0ABQ9YRD7_9CRUS|nr:hypothetical protein OUZ56_004967 [Daphnia magna]